MRQDIQIPERPDLRGRAEERARQLRRQAESAFWRRWTGWCRSWLQRLSLVALPEA